MTEAELQACVIDLAHLYGYRVAHFRPAITAHGYRTAVSADGRGFPDLVIAKPGRVLFVELKGASGQPTSAQLDWLEALGSFAYLWTPAAWDDGSILRTLSWTPASEQPSYERYLAAARALIEARIAAVDALLNPGGGG